MSRRAFSLLDIATVLLAVGLLAAAIQIAVYGPSGPVPMHFDLQGRPDRFGDRSELALLIAALAVITGAVGGGLSWAAGRTDDRSRRRGLKVAQGVSLMAIGGTAAVALSAILGLRDAGAATGASSGSMAILGLMLAAVGAFLGRVGPNVFVGVRTPWAYKSRLAWDRSNRLAGRLFFGIGLIAVLAAPLTPQPIGFVSLGIAVLAAAIWSAVESWRVWRSDPDRQPF